MSSIINIFQYKKKVLNIYLTAGYPELNDTIEIVRELDRAGVDLVEVGMPFSDPLADGPIIQKSSKRAIKNGFNLELLFSQIQRIRKESKIPIFLMGYYNQILHFGATRFFRKAKDCGVNGFIIPDLPLKEFKESYKDLFRELNLDMVFLITPQTSNERIIEIDAACSGFLYVVSSYALTGSHNKLNQSNIDYFNRINQLSLKNNKLIGFGIANKENFDLACKYADGAIIGSAFIHALSRSSNIKESLHQFVKSIRS